MQKHSISQPPRCGCALFSNETSLSKWGERKQCCCILSPYVEPWDILLFDVCAGWGGIQKLCTVIHIHPAWGLQPIICTATARTAFFLTNVGVGGGWLSKRERDEIKNGCWFIHNFLPIPIMNWRASKPERQGDTGGQSRTRGTPSVHNPHLHQWWGRGGS